MSRLQNTASFWNARSQREKILLGVLIGFVLPVAILFLWIMPLAANEARALQQKREAQTMLAWVQDRAAEGRALNQQLRASTSSSQEVLGLAGLEDSLRVVGLRDRVGRLLNRDGDQVELSFDEVEFARLMNWIDGEQAEWGYELRRFRIEALPRDGLVRAEILLEPAR